MRPFHVFLAVFVMVIWGLNFVVAKLGVAEMPPLLLLGLRFFLVAALLCPFVPLPRGKFLHVFGLSVVLGTVHFGLMFWGLEGVDASVAAVAIQLQVPFAALLAAIIFRDMIGWRRAAGMLVAFVGVVLIAGEPRMRADLFSLGLVILASFVWAISNIQVKFMGQINSLTLTAWAALFGAPQLVFWSLIMESGHVQALTNATWLGWASIVYMAVLVSIVGYGIWYYLVPRYQVNQMMPFTLTAPVFGVLSGMLLMGDRMTSLMWIGSALTILGVAVIVLRRPRLADGPPRT